MTRHFLVFLLALATLSAASAQTANPPRTLAGFLKPGTKLGIQSQTDANSISLTIFSDRVFEVANDSRRLTSEALAEKYPDFAKAKQEQLKKWTASLEDRQKELPEGVKFGEPEVSLSVYSKLLLCTVTHVGDDYFLVSSGDSQSEDTQRAFATRFVKSIRWQSGYAFSTSVRHISAR